MTTRITDMECPDALSVVFALIAALVFFAIVARL